MNAAQVKCLQDFANDFSKFTQQVTFNGLNNDDSLFMKFCRENLNDFSYLRMAVHFYFRTKNGVFQTEDLLGKTVEQIMQEAPQVFDRIPMFAKDNEATKKRRLELLQQFFTFLKASDYTLP